jgi:phage FluMu protein Com
MSIEVRCQKCNKRVFAADNMAGNKVKCPECGSMMKVGEEGADTLKSKDGPATLDDVVRVLEKTNQKLQSLVSVIKEMDERMERRKPLNTLGLGCAVLLGLWLFLLSVLPLLLLFSMMSR